MEIINNKLSWNGDFIGEYDKTIILSNWQIRNIKYYALWLNLEQISGIVYCSHVRTNSLLPCIIDDIKQLFNIDRRGNYRIKIGGFHYIIYYIPISNYNVAMWETPLHQLKLDDPVRNNHSFKLNVQKLLAFCHILGLVGTSESAFLIRKLNNDVYTVINTNLRETAFNKNYDYQVVSLALFKRWFNQDVDMNIVITNFLNYHDDYCGLFNTYGLGQTHAHIITEIDKIVKKYDKTYIWLSSYVIERLSSYILDDDDLEI